MDWDVYLRTVLALLFVLLLIGAAAWVARRMGFAGARLGPRRRRRLAISETLSLDGRRRLVLVRRDGVEHLLLIGGASDIIVESGIAPRGADGAGNGGGEDGNAEDRAGGAPQGKDIIR